MHRPSEPRLRGSALLPGFAVLRSYRIGWLRADVLAGLTVGAMFVPQSMAYAEFVPDIEIVNGEVSDDKIREQ